MIYELKGVLIFSSSSFFASMLPTASKLDKNLWEPGHTYSTATSARYTLQRSRETGFRFWKTLCLTWILTSHLNSKANLPVAVKMSECLPPSSRSQRARSHPIRTNSLFVIHQVLDHQHFWLRTTVPRLNPGVACPPPPINCWWTVSRTTYFSRPAKPHARWGCCTQRFTMQLRSKWMQSLAVPLPRSADEGWTTALGRQKTPEWCSLCHMCPSRAKRITIRPVWANRPWTPSASTAPDSSFGARQGCAVCYTSLCTGPYPNETWHTRSQRRASHDVPPGYMPLAEAARPACMCLIGMCFKCRVVAGSSLSNPC